jgi:hypothetical protein
MYMHRLARHDHMTFEQYFTTFIVDTNPERARVCDQHSSQDLLTREDKNLVRHCRAAQSDAHRWVSIVYATSQFFWFYLMFSSH